MTRVTSPGLQTRGFPSLIRRFVLSTGGFFEAWELSSDAQNGRQYVQSGVRSHRLDELTELFLGRLRPRRAGFPFIRRDHHRVGLFQTRSGSNTTFLLLPLALPIRHFQIENGEWRSST